MVRALALFSLTVGLWLSISTNSPAEAAHRLDFLVIAFLVDGAMAYFLVKRVRVAWIYQIATAAMVCAALLNFYESPARHLNYFLAMLIYAGPAALICGFFPVTLRWFWRPSAVSQVTRSESGLNDPGITPARPLVPDFERAPTQKRSKPTWSRWNAFWLAFSIALSIFMTCLLTYLLRHGQARHGRHVADIHTDPKHFWFYVILDFSQCAPIYAGTIVQWVKWQRSKRA
ncbi:hypothetical protein [Robbsia sp. KACC 23696]|uniref:hypothetical protein n=1 Tax=Robbsia sp. KACC 23696 TaxID=3149231 RepID=UPI00325A46F4